jgi:signal transduction histidine kinase
MEKSPVVELNDSRPLDLATYVALVVMYVLGSQTLAGWGARLAAAGLCLAFALANAFLYPRATSIRGAAGYFALQTGLVTGLLLLRTDTSEFFGFLFYVLAIQTAISFPARPAAAWIALFFTVTLITNSVVGGMPRFVTAAFNGAVLVLCGLFGHNLRATELARRHNQVLLDELASAQQRLQTLTLAEERNRLAREIHDGLGHYLTATTMQIQGAKAVLEHVDGMAERAPAALAAIAKAESLLQEALRDVRRSVAALRTAAAEGPSLAAQVGALVANWRSPDGPEVSFALVGSSRPLSSQVELALYRTAQEGLTNVRKHAQAHRADVTLTYADDTASITVVDDGCGRELEGTAAGTMGGFGLLGLRERVYHLGGTLDIQSAPGKGFRLRVELPA